jgi:tyrosine-protein kinase Etk/Wzc
LLVGLVLGFGLGLGVVFLIEYLDRTIKTADEVDRILGIPVLAVVPDVSSSRDTYGYGSSYYGRHKSRKPKVKQALHGAEEVRIELLPALKPRRAVSESYRSLRTALLLSTADGLRSVVVTSAVPGEGKTATATNLAVVLAQLGRDVLIVDADLRKPRQHEIFGVSNRVGLVNYLTGQAEAAQVFLRTNLPNLHVAPSGPVPPNPAELLAATRMHEFVTLARQRFDYVVFDTPPALPVTDATILGALVDGVLLCVGAGLVLREDARSCRDHLRLSEVKVLGAALNRYRPGHGRYGKQYRRYEAYVDAYSNEAEAKA